MIKILLLLKYNKSIALCLGNCCKISVNEVSILKKNRASGGKTGGSRYGKMGIRKISLSIALILSVEP
jgi:hypothetical protein